MDSLTCTACNIDVYLPDEIEDQREEWNCMDYENWLTDHYSELADLYQQISDAEEASWHDRIVRNHEFQARGGFLPGDTVMAEVAPGCWSRSTVLLVGAAMLVIAIERSTSIQAVTQINASWID